MMSNEGGLCGGVVTDHMIIDLSMPLHTSMPVYPGDPEVVFKHTADIAVDGYTVTRIAMGNHTGTHVDMPGHIFADGLTADCYPLERLMGNAVLIDIKSGSRNINKDVLHTFEIKQNDIVVFRTGWDRFAGTPEYYCDYPYLDISAANYLAELNVKCIAIDSPTVDPEESDLPVHKLLLSHNIAIVEGLVNLEKIQQPEFYFQALPLKISASDASPVRAIGIVPDL